MASPFKMKIQAPIITKPIGLGDVVASVTSAVGIKPCGACKKRQEMLNQMLQFQPCNDCKKKKE